MTPLFDNMRTLLNDICTFLHKEITQGRCGDDAKAIATELLTRSSKMIEATQMQLTDSTGYLDMKKKHYIDEYITSDASPALPCDDDKEVYSIPDEVADNFGDRTADKNDKILNIDEGNNGGVSVCPYMNMPVSELGVVVKSGFLTRKEYMLHIIGWQRKYFVVVLDKWLLFFHSNKRGKALETFDLNFCKAKNYDEVGGNFVLDMKEKTFLMTADTRKEKLQWVTIINDIINTEQATLETPIPNKCHDQIKHESISSDSSNIYNDIDEHRLNPTPQQINVPILPPQRNLPEYMNSDETYDLIPAHQATSSPSLPPPRVPIATDEIYDLVANSTTNSREDPPQESSGYPSNDEIYDVIREAPVAETNNVTVLGNQENATYRHYSESRSIHSPGKSQVKSPKKETSNVLKLKQKLQRLDSNFNSAHEDTDSSSKSPEKGKRIGTFSFRSKKK